MLPARVVVLNPFEAVILQAGRTGVKTFLVETEVLLSTSISLNDILNHWLWTLNVANNVASNDAADKVWIQDNDVLGLLPI